MAVSEALLDSSPGIEGLEIAQRAIARANALTFNQNAAVKGVAARVACQAGRTERAALLTIEALELAEATVAARLLIEISKTCAVVSRA